MKKLIFIIVAFLVLTVSCQKADIRPNMNDDSCDLCDDSYSKSNKSNEGILIDDGGSATDDGSGGTITDPNNDEDEDKKKKKK
jgi:hypothetical protein